MEDDDFETVADIQTDAFIPDSYIKNEALKLDIYRRIAAVENKEEQEDMLEELIDRFGDPPTAVMNPAGDHTSERTGTQSVYYGSEGASGYDYIYHV